MIDEKKIIKFINNRIKECDSTQKYYRDQSKIRPLTKTEYNTSVMLNSVRHEMYQLKDHIEELIAQNSKPKANRSSITAKS
jgi:hypothetical protein